MCSRPTVNEPLIPYRLLAWILSVHLGPGLDSFAGLLEGLALYFFVMAFPSLRFPRPYGVRLDAKSQPELFERLERIARILGREMPSTVILTDDMNAGVTPKGGILGIGSKWMLVVGFPLIQIHTISELEATLAHEFGHYHGIDAKLSFLIRETQGAMDQIVGIPEWYRQKFVRITGEMLRAEEYTADRISAQIAGSDVAINALRAHYRAERVTTEYFAWDVLPIVEAGFIPPLAEGFAAKLSTPSVVAAMDKRLEETLSGESQGPRSSHPPLRERIAAIKGMPRCQNPDKTPALSLLRNLPELEHALIAELYSGRKKLKPIAWRDSRKISQAPKLRLV